MGLPAVVLVWVVAFLSAATVFANPVQDENQRPGSRDWTLSKPAVNREIEGYASATSIERGQPIALFVHTQEPSYRIDLYRMGWYGGAGARLMAGGIVRRGVVQPMPTPDPLTGMVECDWTDPYVFETSDPHDPSAWRSGIYLAKLTASSSGAQSYLIFVVREDSRRADLLFQSSVMTYQAYNNWGGKSLYDFNSVGGRARKVSFNRPYAASSNPAAASGMGAGEFLTNLAVPAHDPSPPAGWEYNMVRWLEREGYDVTYSTNVDTHRDPHLLDGRKAWLSIGHDEYWTWEARAHVTHAREQGVGLGFFSANTCYWQVRLEPSPVTGTPDRIIAAYKDDALREDPLALDDDPSNDHLITGRWREPPLDRPEEALIGVMYDGNPTDRDMIITNPAHWAYAGTGVRSGDRLPRLLGYEADRVFGLGPPTVEVLTESLYWYEGGLHVANTTTYTTGRGNVVFAAGTIQWSWGLDDYHAPTLRSSIVSETARQVTRNVLARLVGDRPPSARWRAIGTDRSVTLVFDGRDSFDPDGDVREYRWAFGDGGTGLGAVTSHTFAAPGSYRVTLTVHDDLGAAGESAQMVLITSDGR
ncbi:N,N-dimethylformamidase beta subunit family domain-containing protein [Candidatus Nitrospira bockiana]